MLRQPNKNEIHPEIRFFITALKDFSRNLNKIINQLSSLYRERNQPLEAWIGEIQIGYFPSLTELYNETYFRQIALQNLRQLQEDIESLQPYTEGDALDNCRIMNTDDMSETVTAKQFYNRLRKETKNQLNTTNKIEQVVNKALSNRTDLKKQKKAAIKLVEMRLKSREDFSELPIRRAAIEYSSQ